MQFASPIPIWAAILAVAAGIGIAFLSYYRPRVPLTTAQRAVLTALRAAALLALIVIMCRPVVLVPPDDDRLPLVPVLLDVSRSMRIADDPGGQTRLDAAKALVERDVLPALRDRYAVELYAFSSELTRIEPADVTALAADGRRTDLTRALTMLRDRTRGRPVAGVVIVSDGADTSEGIADGSEDGGTAPGTADRGWPIVTVGVGSPAAVNDREVTGISAGDPRIDQSTIDLRVSLVAHGSGAEPFEVRVLANGRTIDTRRVAPVQPGAPFDAVFTVAPDAAAPTVFTAEIVASDAVAENDARSVLVEPPGRSRRVLMVAGAPGYDHSFAMRALAADPGLEVDAVVRKGKNDAGNDTFLVQAATARAPALMTGFPATREVLFAYDAVVIANMESDAFTRAQLELAAAFVGERGGGLLLFGGQSFAQRGFANTPLADALPVELGDRAGTPTRLDGADRTRAPHTVTLTQAGRTHPVMRIANGEDDPNAAWDELPALAAAAPLGSPRPGATVLAVTRLPGGGVHPLIAVQRYGRGRSLVFGGEAAWRWRMMRPAADRSYEFFWRQTLRWLSSAAPEPLSVSVPDALEPGESALIGVEVRDRSFAPVPDAAVEATLIAPNGDERSVQLQAGAAPGQFAGRIRVLDSGLHRVRTRATRGGAPLWDAHRSFYVGGVDREFTDPRLNEAALRRLAHASNGRYLNADAAGEVVSGLRSNPADASGFEQRDVWNRAWVFAALVALLAAEWTLRRRWGLR